MPGPARSSSPPSASPSSSTGRASSTHSTLGSTSWSGLGAIVVGMQPHGYDLSVTHDRNGWRATFLYRSHVSYPWVDQVLH